MIVFFRFAMIFSLCIAVFLAMVYLSFPSPKFPTQLPDSVQSLEEADTESAFRRAYFTNLTREEVMNHYQNQMRYILGIPLPAYRLNYPPEEAYSFIRDQTRSTFLEEIANPLREYLYVNGFKPKVAKDEIWYKGKRYEQKITVRYISTDIYSRFLVFSLGMLAFVAVIYQLKLAVVLLIAEWFKND